MIFTRVFYNFLIVLKFSRGPLIRTTSRSSFLNMYHVYKHICSWIKYYYELFFRKGHYKVSSSTKKYILVQKIIIPEYPPVLKCFEHTYRCIKCKDFVTYTFLRPHPCFAPSKIKLQSKLCLLLLLEMYRSMKFTYMSILWSLSMPTVELCLQESFHK